MKKLLLSILTLATAGAYAQNVNIPDANFKAHLVGNSSINTNSDTEIQVSEANAFTGIIDCSSQSISNLTGIEAFTALTSLNCYGNQLSSLDVSNNTSLTYLSCSVNQLTSLDITQNTLLETLGCGNNQLTSLDVSNNTSLTGLHIYQNNITNMDLSNLTVLTQFNGLENSLTHLNVANGNNTNFTTFNTVSNSNLSCIQVDNAAYSTANWTDIEPASSFSANCPPPCIVNIPDANFKAYLVGNAAINTNANTEIECSEASAFTGPMFCNFNSIADLTGIEAFTALTALYCYNNSLTSLDLSSNTALVELDCNNNSLTSLNISNNTALTHLYCYTNSLSSIDISNNTALEQLFCYDNSLTSLDVSNNTALTGLACEENTLTSLDVSANTALINLYCTDNSLTSIDISANAALRRLNCADNNLTSLNVANGNNTNFAVFNATNNPNLTCIQVDDATWSTTNWTDIDNTSSFSESCATVGIEEEETFSFGLYPNPTNGVFTVSSPEPVELIEVFNQVGQKVAGFGQVNTIDISNLSNGIYTVKATSNAKIGVARLIKQ